jgi:hypothetical protein
MVASNLISVEVQVPIRYVGRIALVLPLVSEINSGLENM